MHQGINWKYIAPSTSYHRTVTMETPHKNDTATTTPVANDGTFNAIAALVPRLKVGFDGPLVI